METSDENVLELLLPVLEENLDDNDLSKLGDAFLGSSLVTEDTVKYLKSNASITKKIKSLCQSSEAGAQKDHISQLKIFLPLMGKKDLSKIVKGCLSSNQHVLWALRSWPELIKNKTSIKEVLQELTDHNILDAGCVVGFVSELAEETELADKLFDTFRERSSRLQNFPELGQSSSDSVSSDKVSCSMDGNENLLPLCPFLVDCLKGKKVQKLVNGLFDKHCISEEQKKKLKSKKLSKQETIEKMVEFLNASAKLSWKVDFLDQLKLIALPELSHILKGYLIPSEQDSEVCSWLLTNWKALVENEKTVLQIAQDHLKCKEISKSKKHWLIHVMHEAGTTKTTLVDKLNEALNLKHLKPALKDDSLQADEALEKPEKSNKEPASKATETHTKHSCQPDQPMIESVDDAGEERTNVAANLCSPQKLQNNLKSEAFPQGNLLHLNKDAGASKQSEGIQEANMATEIESKSFFHEDTTYEHYISSKYPTTPGKFVFELQAKTTFRIDDVETIWVRIESQNTSYPMLYDHRRQLHTFFLEVTEQVQVYKYFVQFKTEGVWENLLSDERNRRIKFGSDQVQSGLAIVFDVVIVEDIDQKDYEKKYHTFILKFLPSFYDVQLPLLDTDAIPFCAIFKLYNDWMVACKAGLHFVKPSKFSTDMKINGPKIYDLMNFVFQQLAPSSTLPENLGPTKRVLAAIALFLAMAQNDMITSEFSPDIGTSLSLHDVNEDHQNLIITEMVKLMKNKCLTRTNISLLTLLNKIFVCASNSLECLLILPLFKLLESSNSSPKPVESQHFPSNVKWNKLKDTLRKNQKSIKGIADKIYPLRNRFPWLKELYQEIMSLETVAWFMKQNLYPQMFSCLGIFKKLLHAWRELSQHSIVTDEEMSLMCNFLINCTHSNSSDDSSNSQSSDIENNCQEYLKFSAKLLDSLINHADSSQLKCGYVQNTLLVVEKYVEKTRASVKVNKDSVTDEKLNLVEKSLLGTVKSLFKSGKHAELSKDEVELWNFLTSMEWSEPFQQVWITACKSNMEEVLPSKFHNDAKKLLTFFGEKFPDLEAKEIVTTCFTDIVTKHVEEKQNDENILGMFHSSKTGPGSLNLFKISCTIFEKQWRKCCGASGQSTDDCMSDFLFKWHPISTFLKFMRSEKFKEVVKKNTTLCNVLHKINDWLEEVHVHLCSGEIVVSLLCTIIQNADAFCALFISFSKEQGQSVDCTSDQTKLVQFIQCRRKQLDAFETTKMAVYRFVNKPFVKRILEDNSDSLLSNEVDSNGIKLIGNRKVNYNHELLCKLVKCEKIDQKNPEAEMSKTSVIFFPSIEKQLGELLLIHQSSILSYEFVQAIFNKWAKTFVDSLQAVVSEKQASITISNILEKVWIPTKAEVLQLLCSIDDGTVSLKQVSALFAPSHMETDPVTKQLQNFYEFLTMTNEGKDTKQHENYEQRLHQMQAYFMMKEAEAALMAINSLCKQLNLEENCQVLDKLMILKETEEKSLSDMQDYVEIIEMFRKKSKEELHVIVKFAECKQLISWLKDNMKDVNEVKVMSDLALISAGEEALDVDRVSRFLSAVIGFAPLIFYLAPNAGWQDLWKACEDVWSNVETDADLIKNWIATAKQLEWLKEIKDRYGSVEKSSLSRAKLINEQGVYRVGGQSAEMATVEQCLQLKIPRKYLEQQEDIFMTLKDLRDLQSRLMLIAGEAEQGKQDVNRFTTVLSAVEKLAEAVVNLKTLGCFLFNHWQATIVCRNDKQKKTVSVSFDSTSPVVSSKEKIIEELKSLTTVLVEAHDRWKTYLNEKRQKHYPLNHYNIHQLTYLCKTLAQTSSDEHFPDQLYSLLKSVCKKSTSDVIKDALKNALKIPNDDESDVLEEESGRNSLILLNKKKKIVRQLLEEEIAESVAKAAVQAVKPPVEDKCFLWALEYEMEEELVKGLEKKFDDEIEFASNEMTIPVVKDVINNRLDLSLKQVIDQIQQKLGRDGEVLETTGTIVRTVCERYFTRTAVTSLSDCLSLEHLGSFLTVLSESDIEEAHSSRDWPKHLVAGKPNLVVCQLDLMWRNIISIYMTSPSATLPSSSEVLICSEKTTGEDVELLLRRALSKQSAAGQRIFCLACADKLSHIVAKDVEETFQYLVQMPEKNEDYHLVVLTSSQQHYLTSCFDEHLVTVKFVREEAELHKFIEQNLLVKEDIGDHMRYSVHLVLSDAAGMGKSLHVKRCQQKMEKAFDGFDSWHMTVLRFLAKSVDVDDILTSLYENKDGQKDVRNTDPHFIHLDVTHSVEKDILKFVFDLIILGAVQDSKGQVWRRHPQHFYVIEYTVPHHKGVASCISLLELLPSVTCLSPMDVQKRLEENKSNKDMHQNIMMDEIILQNEVFQRPCQYLIRYKKGENLDNFTYCRSQASGLDVLQTLLQFCAVKNPSWLELSHFSGFLNVQLSDCEKSIYCNKALVGRSIRFDPGLAGFKEFVVRFMIQMSQDFATPSLNPHDQEKDEQDLLELHQLRRRWETKLHPYVFFNDDGDGSRSTMSFVHFNITECGDLCHPVTNTLLLEKVMTRNLYQGLTKQGVDLHQNFDKATRQMKLETLCAVFGVKQVFDPDPSYELTTDNVLKMLAIYMRFRCGIPVVIMGETGCGKTRMVEFMSKLKAGKDSKCRNMITLKVHGGVTVKLIQESVMDAVEQATENKADANIETILFLDEANTTEAIYAIKEVMCDCTIHGKPFDHADLKIIAACNPYRKHSEAEMEAKERSGLGFSVMTHDSLDKFGRISMRHLVYRVTPLPPSMHPLVWDFGQLDDATEQIYIKQMVLKLQNDIELNTTVDASGSNITDTIANILSASQQFMRRQKDVCSFVSLRDVERAIQSYKWFYEQLEILEPLIEEEKKNLTQLKIHLSQPMRALIQSLGMCYHVTLHERESYRDMVAKELSKGLRYGEEDVLHEIEACQNVFINAIELERDVAKNEALKENVFMMVVCAEMRIPLFLIGKPGSSKSLAKTIVTHVMQGKKSQSPLFQNMKQAHVLSFQCSPVSDAVGIETMFYQCAQLQKEQDLKKFVAVVVLDEIGLAEDSPKMPLKVLHPLLEVGSTKHSNFEVQPYNKVGFVGISNWALDPAKMNRGIFVTRCDPTKDDLNHTAEAIFQSDKAKYEHNAEIINAVTEAYLEICQNCDREFFGLRDYYGLLKMIFYLVTQGSTLEFKGIALAILRNFDGYNLDAFDIFQKHLKNFYTNTEKPKVSVADLVKQNLSYECESRFLLLLTNQYSALGLLGRVLPDAKNFQVIFGSSFPRDHDYTEVCRNINRVKVCMESGKTVVLLNLHDLYESLYDVLNQQYVTLAGQQYVDLGLGGHRVKCRVAKNFRLIVIEEKVVVYNEFAAPLINRLEKHIFEMNSILSAEQMTQVHCLKKWVENFACMTGQLQKKFTETDAFVGYQEDTAASALLSISSENPSEVLSCGKHALLQTASIDAVVRLTQANISAEEKEDLQAIYNSKQNHDSLEQLLSNELGDDSKHDISVFEVTTFSVCLNEQNRLKLQDVLKLQSNHLKVVTLQQFQTEEEYSEILTAFFSKACSHGSKQEKYVLLIQCPQAQLHTNLIACAKYCAMNKLQEVSQQFPERHIVVAFLFGLERNLPSNSKKPFTSFHSENCPSLYIDELRPGKNYLAPVSNLWNKQVSELLEQSLTGVEQPLVNIDALIRSCLPEAMAWLENKDKSGSRNRVRILNDLCFQLKQGDAFLKPFAKHILHLIKHGERTDKSMCETWILQEACSLSKLQEGGSFKNTLWLQLKKMVGVAVAKVISIADADQNLDLICDAGEKNAHIKNLWLKVFASPFFQAQLNDIPHAVKLTVHSQHGFTCSFPFSRIAIDELQSQWSVVRDHGIDAEKEFVEKMKKSPLLSLLTMALEGRGEQQTNIVNCFSIDLVTLLYKPSLDQNQREIKIVKDSLVALFYFTRKHQAGALCNALVDLFMSYMQIQPKLQCFGYILASHDELINSACEWIGIQKNPDKFVLHEEAFQIIVLQLYIDGNNLNKPEDCKRWRGRVSLARQVADWIMFSDDMCEDTELKTKWKIITFIALFLDQLVPSSSQHAEEYYTILGSQARKLWLGANNVDDLPSFNIVMKILQSCVKQIHLKILCLWKDIRCRACGSVWIKKPVRLPCEHHLCEECIDTGPGSSCPTCRKEIINPQQLQAVDMSREEENELKFFKFVVNNFFLEYLSTFCFPDPHTSSIQVTLQPQTEKVLTTLQQLTIEDKNKKTCKLSLHQEPWDTNPTARSYILQLLLRYDKKLVQTHLNEHFSIMAKILERKHVAFIIYIQCTYDILVRLSCGSNDESTTKWSLADEVLEQCKDMLEKQKSFSQIDHLDLCAKLQFLANVVVQCIITVHNSIPMSLKNHLGMVSFIKNFCALCEEKDLFVLKQFTVKILCRYHGMDALNILLQESLYRNKLIPQNLVIQNNVDEEHCYENSDVCTLSGESYIRSKNKLLGLVCIQDIETFMQHAIHEVQQSSGQLLQVVLALVVWAAQESGGNDICDATFNIVAQRLPMSCSETLQGSLLCEIAGKELDLFKHQQHMPTKMIELISVLGLAFACSRHAGLMSVFVQLITDPESMQNSFLPTMPETTDMYVLQLVRNGKIPKAKFYQCSKGHNYVIGDCTCPAERGKCPKCGSAFDGRIPLIENTAAMMNDFAETGYLLPPPEKRNEALPERALTKVSVCATRVCLHVAMLIGSQKDNAIQSMVKAQNQEDTVAFLLSQLNKDLQLLADSIGKSLDEAFILMHEIFHCMRRSNVQRCSTQFVLSSLESRTQWEEAFQRQFLSVVFTNADHVLNDAQRILNDVGDLTEKPLHRLVNDLNHNNEIPDGIVHWDCPSLWKYQTKISIQHLRLKLEGVDENTKAGQGVLLKLILNWNHLALLKHFSDILMVQSVFISVYEQKLDIADADETTLRDFLNDQEVVLKDELDMYISVWNKVKGVLLEYDRYNTPQAYLKERMSLESPVSMCLPSDQGRGRCALILSEYLVARQNDLLSKCRDIIIPQPVFKEVSIADLKAYHLVCIDENRDMLPLVLANSQYEATVTATGEQHSITYNIPLLERKIQEDFILRKSIIKMETIPQMTYRRDVGLGKDCQALRERVEQIPLPHKLCQLVDNSVERVRTADVCEAVRVLTLVVQFLAELGGNPEQTICDYMEKELLLPEDEIAMIPRSATVCHCLSLFDRLLWHRSLKLISSGQNPFEMLKTTKGYVKLPELDEMHLRAVLQQTNVERLQFELNSLMLTGPELQVEASLAVELISYIKGRTNKAETSWCEKLPGDVLVGHAPLVFEISLKYMLPN